MSAAKRRRKAINRRRWVLELLCKHQGLDLAEVETAYEFEIPR